MLTVLWNFTEPNFIWYEWWGICHYCMWKQSFGKMSLSLNITLRWIIFLPPAMKLGQGNIFISMCQEFCSQGGSPSTHLERKLEGLAGRSPGPHLRGKLGSLARGVSKSTPRGGGSRPGRGVSQHALRQTLPSRWLLLWAVFILLECILVYTLLRSKVSKWGDPTRF